VAGRVEVGSRSLDAVGVEVGEGDGRSRLGERAGRRQAYAGCRSRDEGDLPGEVVGDRHEDPAFDR
jgi:hypothetical protein